MPYNLHLQNDEKNFQVNKMSTVHDLVEMYHQYYVMKIGKHITYSLFRIAKFLDKRLMRIML